MMLVLDIGGTKTALALFDGHLLHEKKVLATHCDDWTEYSTLLQHATREWSFDQVSIATTGRVVDGLMKPLNQHMISFWVNLPVQALMETLFQCPVRIHNDAAAAAWGEFVTMQDPTVSNLLYLTVSTGVGSGLVLDGRLHGSRNGLASHGGHTRHSIVDAPQLSCSCGRTGCVETIASGTAISRRASELLGCQLSTVQVFERAASDAHCRRVIDQSAQAIAELIIDTNALIGLDAVVLGGGVGLNPMYREEVQKYLARSADVYQLNIKQAEMSVDSGLLGAALLAQS